MKVSVIDVSAWQGVINWEKVKESGITHAIIRAGYGTDTQDKYAARNLSECNRLGIKVGVYWFIYALTKADAIANARKCLSVIKKYKIELPVYCDFEYDTINYAKKCGVNLGAAEAVSFSTAFLEEIENAGYFAGNYANQDYMRNKFGNKMSAYTLWYAWYNKTINRNDATMWQYTSSGRVNGISGNVDMNYMLSDLVTTIKNAGLNHLSKDSKPETKPEDKPHEPETKPEVSSGLKIGDKVFLPQSATTYKHAHDGVRIPSWVKGNTYTVKDDDKQGNVLLAEIGSWVIAAECRKDGSANKVFKKGEKVKVLKAINYDNGKKFTLWYDAYDVIDVDGNRAVIGIGKTVTSAIHIENIAHV